MAKFCGKCGAKLDENTGKCPNCEAEKSEKVGQKKIEKRKCWSTGNYFVVWNNCRWHCGRSYILWNHGYSICRENHG